MSDRPPVRWKPPSWPGIVIPRVAVDAVRPFFPLDKCPNDVRLAQRVFGALPLDDFEACCLAALRGDASRALGRALAREAARPGSRITRHPDFKRAPIYRVQW